MKTDDRRWTMIEGLLMGLGAGVLVGAIIVAPTDTVVLVIYLAMNITIFGEIINLRK